MASLSTGRTGLAGRAAAAVCLLGLACGAVPGGARAQDPSWPGGRGLRAGGGGPSLAVRAAPGPVPPRATWRGPAPAAPAPEWPAAGAGLHPGLAGREAPAPAPAGGPDVSPEAWFPLLPESAPAPSPPPARAAAPGSWSPAPAGAGPLMPGVRPAPAPGSLYGSLEGLRGPAQAVQAADRPGAYPPLPAREALWGSGDGPPDLSAAARFPDSGPEDSRALVWGPPPEEPAPGAGARRGAFRPEDGPAPAPYGADPDRYYEDDYEEWRSNAYLNPAEAQAMRRYRQAYEPGGLARRKASRAGDRILIYINESTTAAKNDKMDTKSNAGASWNLGNVLGFNSRKLASLDANAANSKSADSKTSVNTSFVGKIPGRVVDVDPDGVLYIEARKSTNLDGETTVVRLTGFVDPRDLDRDGAVNDYMIMDRNLDMISEGQGAQNLRQGWLSRLANRVKPW